MLTLYLVSQLSEQDRRPGSHGLAVGRMTARKWFQLSRDTKETDFEASQRFDAMDSYERRIFQGLSSEWNRRFATPRLILKCMVRSIGMMS